MRAVLVATKTHPVQTTAPAKRAAEVPPCSRCSSAARQHGLLARVDVDDTDSSGRVIERDARAIPDVRETSTNLTFDPLGVR
jgi:DNA-binding Lrp family transcriptional regulator